jgi:hypothetical protein
MSTPTHVKWYETKENLDGLRVVNYSRASASDTVVSVVMGGLTVYRGSTCEDWKTKWDKTQQNRFEYHFEHRAQMVLSDPLSLTLPILNITDRWHVAQGREFNPLRSMENRVSRLVKFLGDKGLLVPGGTLFFATRPGIRSSLADSHSWSMIMGYSLVEPKPEFSCTLMPDTPDLWLPRSLEVIVTPVVRRSRYDRAWVI